MSKDTHFIGQPVYIQLLNLVYRNKIRKISRRGGHDRYVKKLDGYTHFVAFLFCQVFFAQPTQERTEQDTTVYICTGKYSKCYHKTDKCKGIYIKVWQRNCRSEKILCRKHW